MMNKQKDGKPVGWNLPPQMQSGAGHPGQSPYPIQQGYPGQAPYSVQQGYPGQAPYSVQQGYPGQAPYPLQPEYNSQTSGQVMPTYPHSIPNVEVHGQSNYQNTTEDPEAPKTIMPENFGESFSSTAIRHAFIRKIYSILCVQLSITLGVVLLFSLHEGVNKYVRANMWIHWLSYGVFLVTYLTLVCCSSVRRKWPGNIIMLSLFTLSMAYMLGSISATYKTDIVFLALGMTTVVCFLITLFAFQTKHDFTGCGIYLFVASVILLIFGIMAIIMSNKVMSLLYSAGIVLLFSMYLVYDTQTIMGGKKYSLSAEEHIYGALQLYMDVAMIFLGILGLARN